MAAAAEKAQTETAAPIAVQEPPKPRRGRPPKPTTPQPDPLLILLQQSNLGKIAVTCEQLLFKACDAQEMSEQEQVNLDAATTGIIYHVMKTAEKPEEALPWLAFTAAALAPVAMRIGPISKAAEPYTKSFWEWATGSVKRLWNMVTGNAGK